MTLKKVLYRTRVRITDSWKKAFMMHPLLRIVFISLLAAQTIPNTVLAQVKAVAPLSGVIGKVQSVTDGFIDVQTRSGVVHVDIGRPLTTYKQIPSDLSRVTSTSYVGVASTEQADGKEVAKQIIIFPEELRGAAEGSVLTDPPGATTRSRKSDASCRRHHLFNDGQAAERNAYHEQDPCDRSSGVPQHQAVGIPANERFNTSCQ